MNGQISAIMKAIEYIENHIKDTPNIGELADCAGFSKYHFTRLFKELTGISPYDYYRGRKVTEAIGYLESTGCRIIDAAFEYGFNSPEVFTRSCLSAFGKSPSQIKKSLSLGIFEGLPMLTEKQLMLNCEYSDLKPAYETMPDLFLKGVAYSSSTYSDTVDLNNPTIQTLFQPNGMVFHLHWQASDQPGYHHLIGCMMEPDSLEEDFSTYVYKRIPEFDYLIFPFDFDRKELDSMKDYIYEYFLPKYGYVSDRVYNIEAIRLDENRLPVKSSLYVPVGQKKKTFLKGTSFIL